jgi:hypothetical protein
MKEAGRVLVNPVRSPGFLPDPPPHGPCTAPRRCRARAPAAVEPAQRPRRPVRRHGVAVSFLWYCRCAGLDRGGGPEWSSIAARGCGRISPRLLQQQVREGKTSALAAMKFLVTVARVSTEDCEGMAAAFAQHHCDTGKNGDAAPGLTVRCGDWPVYTQSQRRDQRKVWSMSRVL